MRSFPFINDLFTNVLQKSKAIEGRFFVCPRLGQEINNDLLSQVITETTTQIQEKKYPLCLMVPPRSMAHFTEKAGEWKDFRITLFFLKTTYYDSLNQVSDPNQFTMTSMHTVLEDWHDMERCAANFVRVLHSLQKGPVLGQFRLGNGNRIITPVSQVGADRASGVRLDFDCSVFIGCEWEDYTRADIDQMTIPAADSHPEHQL